MTQMSTASMRNCSMMLPCFAPMAMRSRISRVRSVTDTSMMFAARYRPTSEMSAMPK